MQEFVTHSREETVAVGREFAKTLPAGALIAFTGGLGAGKTAFCQGLAEGLGCTDPVSSPTFAIVNYYRGPRPFAHFDLYRIHTEGDLAAAGFYDYLDMGAVVACEWSENCAELLDLESAPTAVGVGVLDDPGAVRLPHDCGGMRACRPTHYFSTGCRAGCPHPAGTLPSQPIYGQSQYTRPSSALGRGLGHLQSPR